MKQVFYVTTGGGYEWADWAVYTHPRESKRFAVYTDYGCSCNGFEPPSEKDLEGDSPLRRKEVIAMFREWWDNRSYDGRSYVDREGYVERIMESLKVA